MFSKSSQTQVLWKKFWKFELLHMSKFQFQTSRILFFLGVQKLYGPEFHDFYRVCYNFWAIYGNISYFLTT